MKRTYLYTHHDAGVFFLREQELTPEELYCVYCDESDVMIGSYDDEQDFSARLRLLFEEGYDLIPCDEYLNIKDKHCPPELRLWELGQFKEGSPEHTAYAQRLKDAENTYWKKGNGCQ